MKVPTEDEIRHLVGRVVAGGTQPLDEVITRAIWQGSRIPETWGAWPKEAVNAWKFGCDTYKDLMAEEATWGKYARNVLTLRISWGVILDLAANPEEWWRLPGVTWGRIGEWLDTPPRAAAYRMGALGWRLEGSGMGVPKRRVVLAPCVRCGEVHVPKLIKDQLGVCCRGSDG
jgi:hypothetical protein